MPQFLISGPTEPGQILLLSLEESHHLRDVLRLLAGDKIRLADPSGQRYLAEIRLISKKEVTVLIQEKLPKEVPNGVLKLGQALLKREKMEFVIQKAVELGVDFFHPFSSSRTVVSFEKPQKLARWQKIADEALKQCGRGNKMIVEQPVPLHTMVKMEADIKIIFWEEGGEPIREFFRSRGIPPAAERHAPTNTILVLIGPEGGFSREEIETAQHAGFVLLSLGPRILRAETAAIVAMSLIQYELENL
jgi:16S rRNA (uracil1498-N3)-methyltransferase